ncbi:MAG TPA: class I SAM-dependent methyltransferase [Oligoflexia bacterium]|nr:class I SAM-dependent methyltransferase [Oligoflexia bacterium]HMP48145.1 class I SAM-dependent methyltransferase [Oligoflexia bacterium]
MHLKNRKKCRICGSEALTKVINLGQQDIQGRFYTDEKTSFSRRQIPLVLVRCDPTIDQDACGLLQTELSIPPELLYQTYWYRSGTNNSMKNHLKQISEECLSIFGAEVRSVLDIGCNDGTLLNYFPATANKVGIDPSNIIPKNQTSSTFIRDFFPSAKLNSQMKDKKFDVITSIAMLYDLENPIEFTNEIERILADDGIWVFEVSYMPQMLEQGSYDSICHEHLEYYSLAVLENLLRRSNMEIFKVQFNKMNGGSIRCFSKKCSCIKYYTEENADFINLTRINEFNMGLDTDFPYLNFQSKINKHKIDLRNLIIGIKADGKRIHLYGASTKGNSILQWCEISKDHIDYAADRNPDKFGLFCPGSGIKIISEQESRELQPEFYLVMPWHFKEEFLEREESVRYKGVKFIFPLPEIEII